MISCMGVMCVSALAFWLLPKVIIGFYLDAGDPVNQFGVQFATGFLAIAALFQLVDGLQVSASGALRGLKDTKATMIITLVSYWLIGATSGGLLCFVFGFRGNGLWIGMTLGLAAAAFLLTLRFQWQVKVVPLPEKNSAESA